MSAYNWIVFETRCPNCHQDVELRCQAHVAADFGGDEIGRFCHRDYKLGQAMSWWPPEDARYDSWRLNGKIGGPNEGEIDSEGCYTTCPACNTGLYAVVEFKGPCPVGVLKIGLETDWPAEYLK